MFLPCPNCGFLVALITPKSGATEQRCPRCGQVLVSSAADADPDASPVRARAERTSVAHVDDAPREHGVRSRAAALPGDAVGSDALRVERDSSRRADAAAPEADPHGRVSAGHAGKVEPLHASGEDRVAPDDHAPATPAVADQSTAPVAPPAAPGRRAPSFVRRPARTAVPQSRRWPLYLVSAALALILALQLVLAQRAMLAADMRWRPAVQTLCSAFGCAVPAWHEPSAFTMLDRNVQPKAGASGVLTARASFRNDARWPQLWPTLVLSLSDVDGEPLGIRAFTPAEYAGGPRPALAPGQTASVQLDVVEPGPGVVAFAFDFR